MTTRSEATFSVGGRKFILWFARLDANSYSTGCDAYEAPSPLGTVLCTVWLRDPAAVLRSIDGRTGMSIDGDIAFDYGGEDGELPPGVTVWAFKEKELVSEVFFERFVIEFGLACAEAAPRVAVDGGAAFKPALLERRARLGPDAA